MTRATAALVLAAIAVVAAACGTTRPREAKLELAATNYAAIDGWGAVDLRPALSAFLRSCAALADRSYDAAMGGAGYAGTMADWRGVCAEGARAAPSDPNSARAFWEANFVPYAVKSEPPSDGLFTGYYEPLLRGSRLQHDQYQTPIYALPSGYEIPHAPRADIVRDGTSLPVICYVDDKIDAFFLQIQGSGRIQLDDGTFIRAGYAGQNGYPYTAVGAVLLGRGDIPREQMSMQAIRAWMLAHPDKADELMNMNESFVFFIEKPVADAALGAAGTAGHALEPTASIAVDRSIHPLGVPMWIETAAPVAYAPATAPLRRLFVAQDTGGAIKGPVRADIYWGFGADAAEIAGRMKAPGRITLLLPRAVAGRLGSRAVFPLR